MHLCDALVTAGHAVTILLDVNVCTGVCPACLCVREQQTAFLHLRRFVFETENPINFFGSKKYIIYSFI